MSLPYLHLDGVLLSSTGNFIAAPFIIHPTTYPTQCNKQKDFFLIPASLRKKYSYVGV
jgi:hypothetical protein